MKKYSSSPKYTASKANSYGWGPQSSLSEYKYQELKSCINGKSILDVGCGPGHFVGRLSKEGFTSSGIDITPEFVKFAKHNYQGDFYLGSTYNLPFKDKSFDTVFIRSVIEHLEDDFLALKECLRVGKRVVITVPQITPSTLKKRGLLFLHYQDRTHLRNYTPNSLKRLFKKLSAKIIKITPSEQLPIKSILYDSIIGLPIAKRLAVKLIFSFFGERKHYLELLAIIK